MYLRRRNLSHHTLLQQDTQQMQNNLQMIRMEMDYHAGGRSQGKSSLSTVLLKAVPNAPTGLTTGVQFGSTPSSAATGWKESYGTIQSMDPE